MQGQFGVKSVSDESRNLAGPGLALKVCEPLKLTVESCAMGLFPHPAGPNAD